MLLVVTQRGMPRESIVNLSHVVRISSSGEHDGSQVVYQDGAVREIRESVDVLKKRLDRFIMK